MSPTHSTPLRGALWRRGRDVLVIALVSWGLLEDVARVATREVGPHAVPAVAGYALLPYQPDATAMRAFVEQWGPRHFMAPDPELGWVLSHNTAHPTDSPNPQGARTIDPTHVYAAVPAAGVTRLITFGDSFTYGDDVPATDTWQAALERNEPRAEVLNFGVGGYGTDQAYLRSRRVAPGLHAQVSVLGIWLENVARNLNVFRYYLAPNTAILQKPRFVLEGGALTLVNSPVLSRAELLETMQGRGRRDLLALDEWYDEDATTNHLWYASRAVRTAATIVDIYRRKERREALYEGTDPRAIDLTVAIAAQFARDARADGSTPLILVFPMDKYLERYHANDGQLPLVRALRRAGLEVLDTGPPITRAARVEGAAALFTPSGHLSQRGNAIVADVLGEWLAPLVVARDDAPSAAR